MRVVLKDGINAGTFFIEFKRELRKKNNTIVTSCVISQVEVDPFGRTVGLPVSPDRVWRGIARQEPRDKFDKKLGRIIAMSRALNHVIPSGDIEKVEVFSHKDRAEIFRQYNEHIEKTTAAGSYRGPKKNHACAGERIVGTLDLSLTTEETVAALTSHEEIPF
jgi:hypothetical protein